MLKLAKKYYPVSEQLDLIREKFDEGETDFDFFRFRPPRSKDFSDKLKTLIRKKFRAALCKFIRNYKSGVCDIPRPLLVIKEF